MESEFGTFFLSNFRQAPLASSLASLTDVKENAPKAASAALPPLQRLCESESTATPGSSGLFRLAPPPPPTNQFSVGATRSNSDQVVKIETLQEQKAEATTSKTQELEDYGPTGAVFVDDEESLLGDDAPKMGPSIAGQTRDLDSDGEVEEPQIAAEKAEAPVELPPPQPLSPAGEAEVGEDLEDQAVETVPVEPPVSNLGSMQERAPDRAPDPVEPAGPSTAFAFATMEVELPPQDSRPILPGHVQTFRICVPQPFPGVQLRKSQNIDDKHDRFLQDGKEVRGKVDPTGEWVKLKSKHYLPVKVGAIQVLHPVEQEEPLPNSPEVAPVTVEEDETSFWWTCCAGSAVVASIEANDLYVAPQDQVPGRDQSDRLEGDLVVGPAKTAVNSSQGTGGGASWKADPARRPEATVVDLPRHISHPIDPFSDR